MDINFGPGPLGQLVVLVLLTAVSARLLGIRLRCRRTLLAGFPDLIAGTLFVWALTGGGRRPRTLPLPAVLLATRLIAVLLELLARPAGLRMSRDGSPRAGCRIRSALCEPGQAGSGVTRR